MANTTITLHRGNHPGNRSSYTIPGNAGNVVFFNTLFADGVPPDTIELSCEMVDPKADAKSAKAELAAQKAAEKAAKATARVEAAQQKAAARAAKAAETLEKAKAKIEAAKAAADANVDA